MSRYNSTVVSAPVDQVWTRLRDFHDMSWAAGVIERCEAVGQLPGTQIGARIAPSSVIAFVETCAAASLRPVGGESRVMQPPVTDATRDSEIATVPR